MPDTVPESSARSAPSPIRYCHWQKSGYGSASGSASFCCRHTVPKRNPDKTHRKSSGYPRHGAYNNPYHLRQWRRFLPPLISDPASHNPAGCPIRPDAAIHFRPYHIKPSYGSWSWSAFPRPSVHCWQSPGMLLPDTPPGPLRSPASETAENTMHPDASDWQIYAQRRIIFFPSLIFHFPQTSWKPPLISWLPTLAKLLSAIYL